MDPTPVQYSFDPERIRQIELDMAFDSPIEPADVRYLMKCRICNGYQVTLGQLHEITCRLRQADTNKYGKEFVAWRLNDVTHSLDPDNLTPAETPMGLTDMYCLLNLTPFSFINAVTRHRIYIPFQA